MLMIYVQTIELYIILLLENWWQKTRKPSSFFVVPYCSSHAFVFENVVCYVRKKCFWWGLKKALTLVGFGEAWLNGHYRLQYLQRGMHLRDCGKAVARFLCSLLNHEFEDGLCVCVQVSRNVYAGVVLGQANENKLILGKECVYKCVLHDHVHIWDSLGQFWFEFDRLEVRPGFEFALIGESKPYSKIQRLSGNKIWEVTPLQRNSKSI